jgi:hypothetical protein
VVGNRLVQLSILLLSEPKKKVDIQLFKMSVFWDKISHNVQSQGVSLFDEVNHLSSLISGIFLVVQLNAEKRTNKQKKGYSE